LRRAVAARGRRGVAADGGVEREARDGGAFVVGPRFFIALGRAGVLRAGDVATVQDAPPLLVEVLPAARAEALLILRQKQVVAVLAAPGRQGVQEFEVGEGVLVERLNQGLRDADRAVVGARVAPAFEVVRAGDVPVGRLRRFVAVQARVKRGADAAHRLAKVHRGGQVVERVRADHGEGVDAPALHVVDERAKLLRERRVARFPRVHQVHGSADGPELAVEAHCQGVHRRRLRLAGDHHAALAGALEVGGQLFDEGAFALGEGAAAAHTASAGAHLTGERLREGGDLRGRQGEAVVGLPAGEREAALGAVQAAHLVGGVRQAAALGEGARVGDVVAPGGGEEVRVEAGDHLGPVEAVERARGAAGGLLDALPRRVVAVGRVLDPPKLRVGLAEPLAHPGDGGGRRLFHQDRQARVVAGELAEAAHQLAALHV